MGQSGSAGCPRAGCLWESVLAGGGTCCLTAEEALAAVDRTALRRLEGNGCLPTALRAHGHGFGFSETRTGRPLALGLTSFTALGFIFEIFIVEEMLFSRGEYEIRSAIDALEIAVLKLRHGLFPVDDLEQFIEPQAEDNSRLVITPRFN